MILKVGFLNFDISILQFSTEGTAIVPNVRYYVSTFVSPSRFMKKSESYHMGHRISFGEKRKTWKLRYLVYFTNKLSSHM